jgi:ADP-heptose:LPS heptosyltransferase
VGQVSCSAFEDPPGYGLLILGAAENSARARIVSETWPNRVVDACGRLSPRKSAAALRYASIFVGHDSGPLHLAAASTVLCIGLFGSLNKPRKWHPYRKTVGVIHRLEGMSAIAIDEVAKAVSALVPPSGRKRASDGGVRQSDS